MKTDRSRVTTGDILSASLAVAWRHLAALIVFVVAMVIVSGLLQSAMEEALAILVEMAISTVVSYFLLVRMLGAGPFSIGNFAAYAINGMIAMVAVFAGMVLLVVPGVLLMARWALGSALVVERGLGPVEALSESWRRTAGGTVAIAGALALAAAAMLVVLAPLVMVEHYAGSPPPASPIGMLIGLVENLAAYGLSGIFLSGTVALTGLFADRKKQAAEVFA